MNTFNTFLSGALGGLSMGMFHGYITHKMITKQNKEFDDRMKALDDQMNQKMKILRVKCLFL